MEDSNLWAKASKTWSDGLKNKVLKLAEGNLELLGNLIELVNYAQEETTTEMQETVKDWAYCDCDERRNDEPMRDESRD